MASMKSYLIPSHCSIDRLYNVYLSVSWPIGGIRSPVGTELGVEKQGLGSGVADGRL